MEQACAFHPQLVTTYAPEHLNELGFLERSYLWKKRVEQKIEVQRKLKEEVSENPPSTSNPTHPAYFPQTTSNPPQQELILAKLSPSPGLKNIPLSALDLQARGRDSSSSVSVGRGMGRKVLGGGAGAVGEEGSGRAAHLTMELNSFFNLDKDTVQQRKLSHKYLH